MKSRSEQEPYPPFELANRVSSLPSSDRQGMDLYEWLGAYTSQRLTELGPGNVSPVGQRWLDFGCGAGRTMRHFLAEAEVAEIWGTDIDGRSISWLNEHLCPPLKATVCQVDPPLPFASNSFDFIWAISVFTHLTNNSPDWLLELHRILKPGGKLMASYMGELNSEAIAGEPWDEDRIGMNVLKHDQSWDYGGPSVLMSDWWVEDHWGRAFEIESINPNIGNQTWAILRKKNIAITPAELVAPGDDPREWQALKHNLVQSQREIEETSVADASRRTSEDFVNSLSWRITKPLRASTSALRSLKKKVGS